ncbi:GNAT family N-acetyltransferase [Nocardioides sp.]|uniref:GNAT family N-acetyltransferase n=1 Tax=Nocardioides sp. TaxID=35761 RepID=UPI00273322A1|nr:GNAT family protein [Nocardioides sp.]MDP3889764.1 GNAT family protein [Nocardioides sp.]
MTTGVTITTERLLLRTYRAGDAASLFDYYSQADVCRFLLHEPWDHEAAEQATRERMTRTSWERPQGAIALVVELDGLVVGDVAAWTTDDTGLRAEAGWVFDPRHSGRGLATEAVGALFDLLFGRFRLHRVVAQMDARNLSSAHLCERLGMSLEARLRQDWWSKGEWTDTLIYGLLASDRHATTSDVSQGHSVDPRSSGARQGEVRWT